MIRRPPRSTRVRSSAASDVYKRQLLVMPKYRVKNYFAHGRFPEVGQKQKTEKKKKKKRLNDGENNGQATHGARKHAWRTQAAWAKRKRERKEEEERKKD